MSAQQKYKQLKIAFVHPDLGIGMEQECSDVARSSLTRYPGGAERLVVDAALGLQKRGHKVDIYTSHHDPKHCFEETRDGTRSLPYLRTSVTDVQEHSVSMP